METSRDHLLDTLQTNQFKNLSDRLNYATGEMLGADDFQAEQLYHRRQLALALRFLYGSGTLAGLKVVVVPGAKDAADPANLTEVEVGVKPGLAIDRAGRMIEVPVTVSLRLKRWFSFITDPAATGDPNAIQQLEEAYDGTQVIADVFLRFHACERGWTPAFASGPFDALDASQPSRIRDAYELKLVLRKSGSPETMFDPWGGLPNNPTQAQVQDAILSAWDNLKAPVDVDGDFHEVPAELQDPTAIRLARLNMPVVSSGAPASVADLDWRATSWNWTADPEEDNVTNVDNTARNFIVPPAVLRRYHNL